MTHLALARLILRTISPLSIGSGQAETESDVCLLRDANGLPAIPGTALAGILRSVVSAEYGPETASRLFGRDDNQKSGNADDAPDCSRVAISWGHLLDKAGKPIEGLVLDHSRFVDDDIIAALRDSQPVKRDHNRLNALGTADDGGKFDRGAVPAGARFMVQVECRDARSSPLAFDALLECFGSPLFRLGGATRRGYGGVAVEEAWTAKLDLTDKKDFAALAVVRRGLGESLPEQFKAIAIAPRTGDLTLDLVLQPVDFWLIGDAGGDPIGATAGKKPPDTVPYRERQLTATGLGATAVVVPATGIKGPLRHRTAFHLRRLNGTYVEPGWNVADDVEPPELAKLFGAAKGTTDSQTGKVGKGSAGKLLLSDGHLYGAPVPKEIVHNSIDRFTGGVRHGFLFTEEVLYGGAIKFSITLDRRGQAAVPKKTLRAFAMAVEDLMTGRLPIGAASAKGHGFCKGRDWSAIQQQLETWIGGAP